jgi:hypothetical protein
MRRISTSLLALICFTTIASAQNPVVVTQAPGGASALVVSLASAEHVVARMMSFDSDFDGKLAASELPERMHGLVARGDVSGDGTLDDAEIRKLANAPPQDARAFFSGGYTFGDQVGLSSRAHVEGALEDLRLTGEAKDQALDAARWFMDELEAPASANLLKEMESLLTPEQLADFKGALDSESRGRAVRVFNNSTGAAPRRVAFGSNLAAHIGRYALPPAQNHQAHAALGRFTGEGRFGDEERSALLESMKGILSDEERDDLRAALERRPLVKSARAVTFNEFVKVNGEVDLRRVVDLGRDVVVVFAPRAPEPGR